MRVRLILAFLGVAAVAVILAGIGGFALVTRAANRSADSNNQASAQHLVAMIQSMQDQVTHRRACQTQYEAQACQVKLLQAVRTAAKAADASIILVTPSGAISNTVGSADVPQSLDTQQLLAGQPVSGVFGGSAYAAVPLAATLAGQYASDTPVVFVTQALPAVQHAGAFLLAVAAISLLVAALVAIWLGTRISRPLEHAASATARIARGDLAARVPVEAHEYPEIADLTTSINTMAANLERTREYERQFLMSVSHDLRTPLTSIRGYADAIIDGTVDDAAVAAGVIASESRRLQRLVQDLLDLAKLDAHHFQLSLEAVDVAAIVAAVGEAFRPNAEDAKLALEITVPQIGGLHAVADPDRLGQMIANLIENAYRFTRSRIAVDASASPSGQVSVTVADDGPGIAPEVLPHIFDRMYTAQRHAARTAGSGLGLAIVSELSLAMGARVHAESPLDASGGTRMVLELAVPKNGDRSVFVRAEESGS